MLFPAEEREGVVYVLAKQLIGVISQKLLPGLQSNLHLLLEHMENSGAVKQWIERGELSKISDFLATGAQGDNVTFIESIIDAYRSGLISEDSARAACEDPADFNRILLGVSHGSR